VPAGAALGPGGGRPGPLLGRDDRFRTEAARRLFDAAVRAIFTAEPAELSLLFLLFYCRAGGGFDRLASVEGGAQQTRLVGGTQQLSTAMAEPLDVRTATPVRRVEHGDDGVTVHADAGDDGTVDTRVDADYAVVAVPPTAAGNIDYDPALPVSRAGLHQRAPMGHVVKAVATYDEPFWRPELSGEVVADDDTVGLVFDDSPPDGESGALVAFLLADAAREWADRPRAERRQAVLDRLTAYFTNRFTADCRFVPAETLVEIPLLEPLTNVVDGDELCPLCARYAR
jgi:monoamine oxidase